MARGVNIPWVGVRYTIRKGVDIPCVGDRYTMGRGIDIPWLGGSIYHGGLNQMLKRQTSRSHYGSNVPAVTITVFKYRNKIGKTVVKAVPYSVK